MAEPFFKVGDPVRVRMISAILGGTPGVIHSQSLMIPSAYFVLFDGWSEVRLVYARELERVPDKTEP